MPCAEALDDLTREIEQPSEHFGVVGAKPRAQVGQSVRGLRKVLDLLRDVVYFELLGLLSRRLDVC